MITIVLPGCLLVRSSEHILTLEENGSGEGIIHLIDIRSDARLDSLVRLDFDDMMKAYGARKVDEFETPERKITSKRLHVHGDTLVAEITFTFTSLSAIDGLHVTKDELALVFGPGREIVRTNGKTSRAENGKTRISWERDAARLTYEVREKDLPRSVSLAPLFLKYMQ